MQADPLLLRSILSDSAPLLSKICLKVERMQEVNTLVARHLPPDLAAFATVSDVTPEKITIMTPDALRATALRYRQHTLLSALQEHHAFSQLESIKVKIALPVLAAPQTKQRRPLPLTANSKALLQQAAAELKHPALKKALQRLAGVDTR